MQNELNRKCCAPSLRLLCENCGWKHSFYTSKQQGKSFEVNRCLVYSMRILGKGHTSAKKFCTLMNTPHPPAAKNYTKISSVITTCVRSIAKRGFSSRNGCVTAISDTRKVLMLRPSARHVSSVSYMKIQTRTIRNTRDGELTTMYAKQISKVLFLPWNLKLLTVYSGGLWNYTTCGIQKLMEMVTAKVLAGFSTQGPKKKEK